jgi:pyruvate dehydrogenase E2 component (dihydrolipoamide acetyltransferase)
VARVALEVPKVGLVMENARLVSWLKKVGDTVSQGEAVLELETEKSVVEIEATHSGRLVEQLLKVDDQVSVGDTVAWLETDAAGAAAGIESAPRNESTVAPSMQAASASASAAEPKGAQPSQASSAPPSASAMPTAAAGGEKGSGSTAVGVAAGAAGGERGAGSAQGSAIAAGNTRAAGGRLKISPIARRLAVQNNLNLSAITPTDPSGRVRLIDVRRALEASAQNAGRGAQAPQPLSSMRRALARAMTLSNATIPQFAVERAVDWTALQSARTKLSSQLPPGTPKLSANDFLLQAIARALLSYPALNATFRGNPDSPDAAIVPANGAHIGLVVAVENGLLVPVIHGAEQLGLAELARRRSDCVERALKGRLKQSELEGATFSLSNLGGRGPDRFTAIINPPQSAILAVGRQRDCVVAVNGNIQVRPMSDLSLTVDHRVADGRLAAEFLAYLVEILEGTEWRT